MAKKLILKVKKVVPSKPNLDEIQSNLDNQIINNNNTESKANPNQATTGSKILDFISGVFEGIAIGVTFLFVNMFVSRWIPVGITSMFFFGITIWLVISEFKRNTYRALGLVTLGLIPLLVLGTCGLILGSLS